MPKLLIVLTLVASYSGVLFFGIMLGHASTLALLDYANIISMETVEYYLALWLADNGY